MALAFEAAERLFKIGEYAEILRQTDRTPAGLQSLGPRHRGLVAYAMALVGDADAARRAVSTDDHPRHPAIVRSQSHVVLGLAAESRQASKQALEHFQLALTLAQTAGDTEAAAWACLRLLRLLIDFDPTTAVVTGLPSARHAVLRAGSATATAYLHILVTIVEGRSGRIDEARRHLALADALLESAPHKWLRIGSLMNRAGLDSIEGDLAGAIRNIEEAKSLAIESGQARARAHAEIHLGRLYTLTGDFDAASTLLTSALGSSLTSGRVSVSATECLARLRLAQDDLAACGSAIEAIEHASSRPEGAASAYEYRWAGITKARLFLKQDEPRNAVTALRATLDHALAAHDVPLQCAAHLTLAQALVRRGDHAAAARHLMTASQHGVAGYRELQGAFYQASSEVAACPPITRLLAERATRVWASQRLASVPQEMRAPLARDVSRTPVPLDEPSLILAALGGVVDLAHSPDLLASELMATIALVSSATPEIVTTRGAEPPPVESDRRAVLTLGQVRQGQATLHLTCPLPDDANGLLRLLTIFRIGRTALDAERGRQAEASGGGLWPADTTVPEAGGLFIADEMRALLSMAKRVAPTTVPVLITGETGTGKEVLARAIHDLSSRSHKTFLPFNCASTPREILDSQLFGHRRGSFTGATEHFPGVIRCAAGGTLFLDEIGDMTVEAQPKLLRFLESGEIHPVGETAPVRTDVRIIAATNADLDALVAAGRFREDLFYRLNVVRLRIPPLRERRIEIPALAQHFLDRCGREWDKGDLRLSEDALEHLALHDWPGNVRQLANEMRRVAAIAEPGAVVTADHLSADVRGARRTTVSPADPHDPSRATIRLDQTMAAATEHLERKMLEFALERCHGRIDDTAEMLGLSRKGLYLKRHRLGIEPPPGALGTTKASFIPQDDLDSPLEGAGRES